jgi:hypothetical protein
MRTEAVSGDKPPLPPRPLKGEAVAVHTLRVAVPGNFATWVLSTGTMSESGQTLPSVPSLHATASPSGADELHITASRREGPLAALRQ